MTIYFNKSRGRWLYDFRADGRRYAGYCIDAAGEPAASKRAAQQAEGVARRAAASAQRMPRADETTLGMVITTLSLGWQQQAHWPNRKRYIEEILAAFGPATPITEISEAQILDYIARSKAKRRMIWKGGPLREPHAPEHERFWQETDQVRAPATINLYLGVLRQAFERASKMRDPITQKRVLEIVPHVPELAVPKRKARPIPDAFITELMATLPQHVVEAITLTLYFGFRRQEVFGLEVHNVDFDGRGVRLFHEGVKDNEDTFLPAGPEAMAYLTQLVDQARSRGVKRIITWRRPRKETADQAVEPWRSMKRSNSAWKRAMKEVGGKFGRSFRWHDIRAAFITHVAMTSGQLAAQALARHRDYDTTRAYVEVADELRRTAAERAGVRPALSAVR